MDRRIIAGIKGRINSSRNENTCPFADDPIKTPQTDFFELREFVPAIVAVPVETLPLFSTPLTSVTAVAPAGVDFTESQVISVRNAPRPRSTARL
jgi:hypothetical protein